MKVINKGYFDMIGTTPTGLPAFAFPVAECTALNSSPYLCAYEIFEQEFGRSPARRELLEGLAAITCEAKQLGAKIVALLVGGSFLNLNVEFPGDLDAICFFDSDGLGNARTLVEIQTRARAASIDIRFVPYSANPLIALKACSFFTLLYSINRKSREASHGALLVAPK